MIDDSVLTVLTAKDSDSRAAEQQQSRAEQSRAAEQQSSRAAEQRV